MKKKRDQLNRLLKKKRKWIRVMKITTLLLLFGLIQINAKVLSQGDLIKINERDISLEELLWQIQKKTNFVFVFSQDHVRPHHNLNVKLKGQLDEVLTKILSSKGLTFEKKHNVYVIKKITPAKNPKVNERTISGKIIDENGEPLPGVSVFFKETPTVGTISDFDGEYSITKTLEEQQTLVFSYIGYERKEIRIEDKTTIDVSLIETTMVEEVVITGYQKLPVERSTGSAVTITSEDMEKKGQSNLVNSLEGMIAGLSISADPNSEGGKKITIRGVATINGNSEPLVVIDGFPVNTDISQINPYDVESVTVLKDAGAASIYGARAANGVIVITTKRGKVGKVKVNYTNSFTFHERPDIRYRLNRVSSSDLVDIQKGIAANDASLYTDEWLVADGQSPNGRALSLVHHAMARLNDAQASGLTDFTMDDVNALINPLRSIDNTDQLRDYFTQKPYEEQHNLSISGGGDKNAFRATVNYTKNKSSFVGDKSERVIFDFQNNTKLGKRFKLDLNGNFSLNDGEYIPINRDYLFDYVNSYELFKDENGNALPVTLGDWTGGAASTGGFSGGKSSYEIQRLIDLGLYDETYYPIKELETYRQNNKSLDVRLQAMLYADLLKGLKANVGFSYETSSGKNTRLATEESFEMRNLINNLSPISYSGDEGELNIPRGGRLSETRSDSRAYTLRAQLDYEKSIDKHNFRALAGTEVRHLFNSFISTDQFGYQDASLQFVNVNKRELDGNSGIPNLNIPGSYFFGGVDFKDAIFEITDRFFSGYGNFSYDYDRKYVVSGSMRIDQSNLFGTDPKYRYKPFWSAGGKWNVNEEDFFKSDFINRLALRASYGINGNIANDYGPFNIAQRGNLFYANSANGLQIITPAVQNLRWERTATTNVGLEITMANRRVRLGLDYYLKNTSDILAFSENDPTSGFTGTLKNDANIRNNGYEISLTTQNVKTEDFTWSSSIMLRYNKNEVRKIFTDIEDAGLIAGIRNLKGYAANGYHVFDWAGLNSEGQATIYNKAGDIITVDSDFDTESSLSKEDLVFAGSIDPKVSGSVSNNLSYKNFDLSFMFVFSYGNVLLKDSYNGGFIRQYPVNINADAAKAWEQPGDENTTDILAINQDVPSAFQVSQLSTKNILNAGFIRLREVILSYRLPEKALRFLSLENASINVRANNLLLIEENNEGIDPEAHGFGRRYFPINPSYSFGIIVGF